MRIEYIKPLKESVGEILSRYVEIMDLDISLISKPSNMSGVVSFVSLSGYFEGYFLVNMSEDTSILLIEAMSLSKFVSFDKYSISVLEEFVNLIAALFVTKLSFENYDVDVSVPILMSGDKLNILLIKTEALQMRIKTSIGYFNMLISIESEKE